MPKVKYPDIPDVAGTPKLPRSPQFSPTVQAALGALEGVIFGLINAPPVWGVFKNGKKVLNPTSISAVEYKQEFTVPQFPVEGGKFAQYNKVANPSIATIRMIKSGMEAERAEFLGQIELAVASLENYTILTPERAYDKCNLIGYDYRRESSNGAYQIAVDLNFMEVREVTATYTTQSKVTAAKEPSGVPTKPLGIVQPKIVDTAATNTRVSILAKGASVVRGWWGKLTNKPSQNLFAENEYFDKATINQKSQLFDARDIKFTNLYPLTTELP